MARSVVSLRSSREHRRGRGTDLGDGEGVQADDGEEERVARVGGLSGGLLDDALPLCECAEVVADLFQET